MSNYKYTKEQIQFLKEYSPSHTVEQTWEKFFDMFEMDVSQSAIRSLLHYYNIPSSKCLISQIRPVSHNNNKSYRRTNICGTEEVYNLMDDVCRLYDMKKYEFCEAAIDSFLKYDNKVSTSLKTGKYPKTPVKHINIEIPVGMENRLQESADRNTCALSTCILQAIINYGVFKLPQMASRFKSVNTVGKLNNNVNVVNKSSNTTDNTALPIHRKHRWDSEEIEYLKKYAPENTLSSLTNLINNQFGLNVTESAVQKQMSQHHIYIGIRQSNNLKQIQNLNTTVTPSKTQKYYVNGMDEIQFIDTNTDNTNVKTTKIPKAVVDVYNGVVTPEQTNTTINGTNDVMMEDSIDKPENLTPKIDVKKVDTKPTNTDTIEPIKPQNTTKQYVIPNDLPKIIEKARKLTSASRFEFTNCAVRYYLSKKWHIDNRLKSKKYTEISWLNSKFVQPVVITLETISQLEKVAKEFRCKISTILIQAYLDYSSKIFEDFDMEFNYIFEFDLNNN